MRRESKARLRNQLIGALEDSPDPKVRTVAIVLLTGTTGGLGSFFLAQLLENPVVERVYASIAERQKSGFVDKALPVDILNSAKLAYMEVDASQDNCGLTSAVYDELRNSVTVIIHNAWRLDFNLSL